MQGRPASVAPAIALLAGLLLTACIPRTGGGEGPAAPRPTLVAPPADLSLPSGLRLPNERGDAAAALATFARECSACHGAEGRGDGPRAPLLRPPPADFRDPVGQRARALTWQHRSIAEGKGAMPPWALQVDDRRLWDLAFLTWSMALAPRAGDREAFDVHCAACHGPRPTEAAHRLDLAARAAHSFDEELALLAKGPHEGLGTLDPAAREAALRWAWTQVYEPVD